MDDTLDLHDHGGDEAIERFVTAYNRRLAAGDASLLDVVHGYGSRTGDAIIRRRLRGFLRQHPRELDWLAGEDVDGNPGHSLVQPRHPLPSVEDRLAQEILDWCQRPRTMDKIAGRFRRHGQPRVMALVQQLAGQGRLLRQRKAAHTVYLRFEP